MFPPPPKPGGPGGEAVDWKDPAVLSIVMRDDYLGSITVTSSIRYPGPLTACRPLSAVPVQGRGGLLPGGQSTLFRRKQVIHFPRSVGLKAKGEFKRTYGYVSQGCGKASVMVEVIGR